VQARRQLLFIPMNKRAPFRFEQHRLVMRDLDLDPTQRARIPREFGIAHFAESKPVNAMTFFKFLRP